ncbi:MAG: tetraacyldisaccharide 4'-kinase [Pyrinomonadaceae bacterium]
MLSAFSRVYGKIISYRNLLYTNRHIEARSLGRPTISIGNITVGGTGKTPLTALIAELLYEMDERVCIISRGYGRRNPKESVLVCNQTEILATADFAGDEPFELAKQLLGRALVISDGDRIRAAKRILDEFDVSVFVLDDGFQHRRAKRDLDIVVIDATNPFGNGKTLPAGILREPLTGLTRADFFIITRADLVSEVESIKKEIRKYNQSGTITIAETFTNSIKAFGTDQTENLERFRSESKNYVFCGIGNPEAFVKQLDKERFTVAGSRFFRDHAKYTQQAIAKIEKAAEKCGANRLLTTPKDATKLVKLNFNLPCFVVASKVRIEKLHDLWKEIDKILLRN